MSRENIRDYKTGLISEFQRKNTEVIFFMFFCENKIIVINIK